ncbi:MAG TPA: hypothetical protein VGJ26_03500, partial [Pirellulales bacterium]
MKVNRSHATTILFAVVAATGMVRSSWGQSYTGITFTIDPSLSYFTLGGDIRDPDPDSSTVYPFIEQTPGSMTEALNGSLYTTLYGTYGSYSSIYFSSASIGVLSQPGPFDPGGLPANFAAFVDLTAVAGQVAQGAFRNSTANFYGGGYQPIDGSGDFPVVGTTFTSSGTFDYAIPTIISGSSGFYGSAGDMSASPGNVHVSGGNVDLSIPISGTTTQFDPSTGLTADYTFAGNIVAHGVLPPPPPPP